MISRMKCNMLMQSHLWRFGHLFAIKVLLIMMALLTLECQAFCPNGCQCDDVGLRVHCVNANLDTVPILLNPGTKHLDLSHNHIKSILSGFTFYHEMQYLDISHNEVTSLGNENFASQVLLTSLIVSNNKITEVQDRTFGGLADLKEIDLSDNYIKFISSLAFRPLTNLRILDISNNKITNFTTNTFKHLSGLKILNLCKNKIKTVSREIFDQLVELQELHLCSNEIEDLGSSVFQSLKNLVHLSIFSNKISVLNPKAFVGLDGLKLLDVHDNLLKEIPVETLSILRQLEELNLGTNSYESLSAGSFKELISLRNLYISYCEHLTFLDPTVFQNLENLLHLEMSFNSKLSVINTEVFEPLTELRRLVLRGNGLTSIDESLFRWVSLQYLDVRDNSFVCNCSMKWLQELQRNKSLVMKIEDIVCDAPEFLKERMLANLTDYELECYNKLLIAASCVAIIIGFIVLAVIIGVVYYRHCRKMKTLVHDHWPEKIVATWRDPEYEKQLEDEEYTFQSARSLSQIQIPVICQELSGDLNRGSYPPTSGSHDELLERTLAFKNPVQSRSTRDTVQGGSCHNGGEDLMCTTLINGTTRGKRPLENPYATHSLIKGTHRNHCKTRGDISSPTTAFAPPQSIYAEPNALHQREDIWKFPHHSHQQVLKDSGYYSCEFLDLNGTLLKDKSKSQTNKNGSMKQATRSLHSKQAGIPESDSGVFTLSHIYMRPTPPSLSFPNDGIYDNII